MKNGWAVMALLLCVGMSKASGAQSIYGQFSVSQMTSPVSTNYLFGATAGVLVDGPLVLHHVRLSGDVQGRFVGKSGEKLDGVAVGPRLSFSLPHGIAPYGEFLVGFARYSNPNEGGATTDGNIQINGGVAKRVSPRWDATFDYSYTQYYALGNLCVGL